MWLCEVETWNRTDGRECSCVPIIIIEHVFYDWTLVQSVRHLVVRGWSELSTDLYGIFTSFLSLSHTILSLSFSCFNPLLLLSPFILSLLSLSFPYSQDRSLSSSSLTCALISPHSLSTSDSLSLSQPSLSLTLSLTIWLWLVQTSKSTPVTHV